MAVMYPPTSSVAGQGVVDEVIQVPWWPGNWTVTQGWGPTGYGGEPEGHGYPSWHAGVDVGADCGTVISLPQGIEQATVKAIDNPGGYGTALVVELGGHEIWLGHLASRLVQDGQTVRAGDMLAISNNSGNSTGCHIHFEVRPAGGRYGTDVDPSPWLFDPAAAVAGDQNGSNYGPPAGSGVVTLSSTAKGYPTCQPGNSDLSCPNAQNPYLQIDPRWQLWELEHQAALAASTAGRLILGQAQVGLGSLMMISGLFLTVRALQGAQSVSQAAQPVTRYARRSAAANARQGRQQAQARTVEERASTSAAERAQRQEAEAARQGAARRINAGARHPRFSSAAETEAFYAGLRDAARRRPGARREFQSPAETEAYLRGRHGSQPSAARLSRTRVNMRQRVRV